MPLSVLLDSVILIDHFNGIAEATAYLGQLRHKASISVITRAEVPTGFEASDDRQKAAMLLDCFPVSNLPSGFPTWQPACDAYMAGNYPMPSKPRLPSIITSVSQPAIPRIFHRSVLPLSSCHISCECPMESR